MDLNTVIGDLIDTRDLILYYRSTFMIPAIDIVEKNFGRLYNGTGSQETQKSLQPMIRSHEECYVS